MSRNRFLKMEGLTPLATYDGIDNLYYKNKSVVMDHLILGKLATTLKIFKWKGLPKTLNPRTLELSFQRDGLALVADITQEDIRTAPPQFTDYKDVRTDGVDVKPDDIKWEKPEPGLYVFLGSNIGGVLDENYLPTLAILTNPYLLVRSLRLRIGEQCVLGWNDSMMEGLSPINGLYGGLLAESLVSLRLRLVLSRSPNALIASSDEEKAEAEKYLKDLDEGTLGVLASKSTLNNILGTSNSGLRSSPLGTDREQSVKEILETIQYINAQWNIRLGLNDNYNMKREALNSTETEANSDTLYPLIEDMLACRKKFAEDLNKMYGTEISVDLNGQWKRLMDTEEIRMEYLEKTAEEIGNEEAPETSNPIEEPKEPEEPKRGENRK